MRRTRRSNAEINEIYRTYISVREDFDTVSSLAKKLDVSATVVKKWNQGKIPLPDADPKPKDFYNSRTRDGYTPDEFTAAEIRFAEDTFDAEVLGITLEEYRAAYVSGMEKIHLLIKNDSSMGLSLREFLNQPERDVWDGQF